MGGGAANRRAMLILCIACVLDICRAFTTIPWTDDARRGQHFLSWSGKQWNTLGVSQGLLPKRNPRCKGGFLLARSMAEGPSESLKRGEWFKLICGASNQDMPQIRNLALAYTLAGVDCIDCSADPAVVAAVNEGVDVAIAIGRSGTPGQHATSRPWIMVSINDDDDPHFRKARFDPKVCPPDCKRPCESVCPADAISDGGVSDAKCYGCGRCLPACPLGLIIADSYQRTPLEVTSSLSGSRVDAVEIHTAGTGTDRLDSLWEGIGDWARSLKLVAVSFPDPGGDDLAVYMREVSSILTRGDPGSSIEIVWQTDGRPMSGDVGRGMAHAAVSFAKRALDVKETNSLPGYVQLAGGTNDFTAELLSRDGLFPVQESRGGLGVGGAAFGGYARKALQAILDDLGERGGGLEEHPDLLGSARDIATGFVQGFKKTSTSSRL